MIVHSQLLAGVGGPSSSGNCLGNACKSKICTVVNCWSGKRDPEPFITGGTMLQ